MTICLSTDDESHSGFAALLSSGSMHTILLSRLGSKFFRGHLEISANSASSLETNIALCLDPCDSSWREMALTSSSMSSSAHLLQSSSLSAMLELM